MKCTEFDEDCELNIDGECVALFNEDCPYFREDFVAEDWEN